MELQQDHLEDVGTRLGSSESNVRRGRGMIENVHQLEAAISSWRNNRNCDPSDLEFIELLESFRLTLLQRDSLLKSEAALKKESEKFNGIVASIHSAERELDWAIQKWEAG